MNIRNRALAFLVTPSPNRTIALFLTALITVQFLAFVVQHFIRGGGYDRLAFAAMGVAGTVSSAVTFVWEAMVDQVLPWVVRHYAFVTGIVGLVWLTTILIRLARNDMFKTNVLDVLLGVMAVVLVLLYFKNAEKLFLSKGWKLTDSVTLYSLGALVTFAMSFILLEHEVRTKPKRIELGTLFLFGAVCSAFGTGFIEGISGPRPHVTVHWDTMGMHAAAIAGGVYGSTALYTQAERVGKVILRGKPKEQPEQWQE